MLVFWGVEKTGVHCTWRETLTEQGENPQQTQPTFGVTARICARATLVRALRHPCYRLLKTSGYRCLIIEVIVPHRDGLDVLLLYQSQSHFAKWKINIKLFFFSKNDCKKSWQNVSFSNCWAFATGWISSAQHFGNTMFLYVTNHSLQVTFSFSQEKRSREALFSPHHKFCAPKTNKTKAEPRHRPSVLRVNFHHRLNVIYARQFYATV